MHIMAGNHHVSAVVFGSSSAAVASPVVDDCTLPPGVLQRLKHSIEAGVTGGFRIASGSGPLCDEPLCTCWMLALQSLTEFVFSVLELVFLHVDCMYSQ